MVTFRGLCRAFAAGAMLFAPGQLAVRPSLPASGLVRPAQASTFVVPDNGANPTADLDSEIERMGAASRVTDPVQQAYETSGDSLGFALDRLPQALNGDGASSYFIYLVLEQCRSYLRLDVTSARELAESVQTDLESMSAAERDAWAAEYRRCAEFSNSDWTALADGLGKERPGAETEVGSVWYERALRAGYPAALAEEALRFSPLNQGERRAQLEDAVVTGSGYARWLLFADDQAALTSGVPTPEALAWLVSACRTGMDCTATAEWFTYACQSAPCLPSESALAHYWYAAPVSSRQQAWDLAAQIDEARTPRQLDALPWPDLRGRDTREMWSSSQPPKQ